MALLGVILLLAGIGAGVFAYVGTHAATGTTTVTAFGFSREATPLELVAYGAIAMFLFALGWALLTASARRRGRVRRQEREGSRVAELEERSESDRLEYERRLEEAGLRNEDLRRRESELAARHEGLDQREAELVRREAGTAGGATSSHTEADRMQDPDDGRRTAWVDEAPSDPTAPADEPPARPAETRGRAHEAPRQNV